MLGASSNSTTTTTTTWNGGNLGLTEERTKLLENAWTIIVETVSSSSNGKKVECSFFPIGQSLRSSIQFESQPNSHPSVVHPNSKTQLIQLESPLFHQFLGGGSDNNNKDTSTGNVSEIAYSQALKSGLIQKESQFRFLEKYHWHNDKVLEDKEDDRANTRDTQKVLLL